MSNSLLRCAILAFLILLGGCAPQPSDQALRVTLLAINDFHGNLETPGGTVEVADPADATKKSRVRAGGAAHLATLLKDLAGTRPNPIVVASGDLIGGSPSIAALLRNEPAIQALDAMRLEVSSVGNHEFDRGVAELKRMQNGGCHAEGCFGEAFSGAKFKYLAANVIEEKTGATLFAPYFIKRFEGVAVAFVGVVLKGAASIVIPSGVAGVRFLDEAETVNALIPDLKRQGVEAIVVLIHEGGATSGSYNDPACPDFRGAIIDVVKRLDSAVDAVVSGHTHAAYVCRVGSRLVTQAGNNGRFLTVLELIIDRRSRDVVSSAAQNLVVDAGRYAADATVAAIVARAKAATAKITSARVGSLAKPLPRAANNAGQSALGDVVADAQLLASAAPESGGAQFALINFGALRADLLPRDGALTLGDVLTVMPFENELVVLELKGAQIAELLEQQWTANTARIMQVSSTFSYTWDAARPVGSRVVPGSIALKGKPIDPAASYRVVVIDFLAEGGDGFLAFKSGTWIAAGGLLRDAFANYLRKHPELPASTRRIGRVN